MDSPSAHPRVVPLPAPMEAPSLLVAGIAGGRRAARPPRALQESLQGLGLLGVPLRPTS